jgi:DNA-dependent protein kinase catalytic subunit
LSEIFYLKDESEAKLTIKNIEANLNRMLTSSESYNPNFVACILEIALKHVKNFRLDISSISNACLNSLQQSLGIILIEEYIVQNENDKILDEEPKLKKIKLSNNHVEGDSTEESLLWIELAKLYRSMNDYDSIKGIFRRKNDLTSEITKNGFYHESNNDYYQARKCYMDGLNQLSTDEQFHVPKIEEELWEQSLLRCCMELTDWKTMCEWSTQDTNLENLFTIRDENSENAFHRDGYYKLEYIFPYALRSKIKLILQEDVEEQKKHQDLIKFLQGLDADGKKYMEQNFNLEMAMINLHQKDYNAAKYYANMAIQKYLTVI